MLLCTLSVVRQSVYAEAAMSLCAPFPIFLFCSLHVKEIAGISAPPSVLISRFIVTTANFGRF